MKHLKEAGTIITGKLYTAYLKNRSQFCKRLVLYSTSISTETTNYNYRPLYLHIGWCCRTLTKLLSHTKKIKEAHWRVTQPEVEVISKRCFFFTHTDLNMKPVQDASLPSSARRPDPKRRDKVTVQSQVINFTATQGTLSPDTTIL